MSEMLGDTEEERLSLNDEVPYPSHYRTQTPLWAQIWVTVSDIRYRLLLDVTESSTHLPKWSILFSYSMSYLVSSCNVATLKYCLSDFGYRSMTDFICSVRNWKIGWGISTSYSAMMKNTSVAMTSKSILYDAIGHWTNIPSPPPSPP